MTTTNPIEERLHKILFEMTELTGDQDTEVAHSEADALLLEVIELLMPVEYDKLVYQIMETYEAIGKWYA